MSFFEWTGNPFVDSGIAAILRCQEKRSLREVDKDDILTVSSLLQQIYRTKEWQSSLYSIFVNYPLGNASYNIWEVYNSQTGELVPGDFNKQKAKRFIEINSEFQYRLNIKRTEANKLEKLKQFINELVNGISPLGDAGDCIACGRRNTRKRKNRQHIPMTGSGGALNFFSFTADGADYCDTCAFAIQCSPLTYYACDKLAMLHSNSPKVMRYWAKRSIGNIQKQIALNHYTGCFNEGYTNPQNALFHITQDLILTYEEQWAEENATICLYHFTNYIQGPDLNLYDLPAPVFRFLANVQAHPRRKDWYGIVRRGYYFIKNGKEIGFSIAGKTENDYKNSKNRVYQSLLAGKSILPRFLNTQARRAYGDYSLLTLYLREILAMDQKRIETVKRVADEIAAFIQQSPDGKRRLRSLEESVRFRDFCNALRRISKARIKNLHPQEPLFTLDEFAEQLFPDGALTFGETRYLILFRLYEQLHQWLLAENLTEDEVDDSVTEVGDDINPAIEE